MEKKDDGVIHKLKLSPKDYWRAANDLAPFYPYDPGACDVISCDYETASTSEEDAASLRNLLQGLESAHPAAKEEYAAKVMAAIERHNSMDGREQFERGERKVS